MLRKNLNMVNLNTGTFRTNFKLQLHINMRPTNFTLTYAINKNFPTFTWRPLIKSTLILTWHDHATLMKTSKLTISIFPKITIRVHNLKTRFSKFQTKTAIKLSISLKKYYSNIIVQTELVIFCNRKFQTRKTILKVFNYLACQYNADLIKDSQYLQLILTSPSGYCKSKIFQKSDIFLMGSKLNQKSSWNFKSLINTKRHQRKRRRRKV